MKKSKSGAAVWLLLLEFESANPPIMRTWSEHARTTETRDEVLARVRARFGLFPPRITVLTCSAFVDRAVNEWLRGMGMSRHRYLPIARGPR